MSGKPGARLSQIYASLHSHYGPQHWWPAKTPLEMIVGAILTQNTSWKNVEKAIARLQDGNLLSYKALRSLSRRRLASAIRPSGYYNIKADRIRAFLDFLEQRYGGNLTAMCREETETLRARLLNIWGIGPETADSILLYAAGRPVFVVDTYTRRVLSRHGLCQPGATYDQIQRLFHENLDPAPGLFNEYHALLVQVGKGHCTPKPVCSACPLKGL